MLAVYPIIEAGAMASFPTQLKDVIANDNVGTFLDGKAGVRCFRSSDKRE
ncbi:MAG: hypothetical protein LBG19_13405 [Prevotellaceae bacterium]|nr:hypothetical protein [Prevotellaceae bacterium]